VSTAVASPSSSQALSGKAHFYLRRLHSLTGVLFGGYIIFHLMINATLVQGRPDEGLSSVYQLQVDKIHGLPFLEMISLAMIILPLAFHTLYGIYVSFQGKSNPNEYGFGKNWFYVAQRASAFIIMAFALFHVLTFKGFLPGDLGDRLSFVPHGFARESTVNHMHAAWWVGFVIYPLGILASTFHLANGFWTGAISWGLTVSKSAQQRWGVVCVGIFIFSTICGLAALGAALAEKPRKELLHYQQDPHKAEVLSEEQLRVMRSAPPSTLPTPPARVAQ
jgi:succinate dehydrogenase / fumarate reductase, cytochrome b subunit